MKKLVGLATAVAFSLGSVTTVQAAGITFAVGQSSESTWVYRLGTQFDFNTHWLANSTGHLSGYWDAGYTFWHGDDSASKHSISLMPAFVYEFTGQQVKPYVEAGIGIAAFSSSRVESNKLGSSLQFEDRIGAGLRFAGGQEVGIRATHYSNGGLQEPNDGIEAYSLHYRLNF
jgi:lipid A 3-O-deacylase